MQGETPVFTSPTPTTQTDSDSDRKVYVGNLPFRAKWQDLKDHMKQAGTVDFCKVLTEDGTDWGWSRGVGVVTFATPAEAARAIEQLNETTLIDRKIKVDQWTGSTGRWKEEQGGSAGPKVGKGAGKGQAKGSWGKGLGKGFHGCLFQGGLGWYGKGFGKSVQVVGDPKLLVYVGNLPYSVKWQDLKDHMKQVGTVEFCKVLTEDGSEWGWSKGVGCVRYSTETEVEHAISTLAESELKGRRLLVDRWVSRRSVAA